MKNSDLITKLQELPPDMEVCILDAAQNNKTDDTTSKGIHREIDVYQVMTNEELEQLQEDEPTAKHWIAIEFNDNEKELEIEELNAEIIRLKKLLYQDLIN